MAKRSVNKRKASGAADHFALAFTTWGVGYIPGAPGTYGSAIAVAIYVFISWSVVSYASEISSAGSTVAQISALYTPIVSILLSVFVLVGIWAASRSVSLLGNDDPSEAVVDELMGQFITFLFVPFGVAWPIVLVGFLLFRVFDIWKPYPIDGLQVLPSGLGICADDIVAGIYAGICLSVIYWIYLHV
jgi:phosphatidylglycerophosphatase A